MTQPPSLSLNGTNYLLSDLPEDARTQVGNIQAVDAEIAHLQRRLAIAQTARSAYTNALAAAINAKSEPASS